MVAAPAEASSSDEEAGDPDAHMHVEDDSVHAFEGLQGALCRQLTGIGTDALRVAILSALKRLLSCNGGACRRLALNFCAHSMWQGGYVYADTVFAVAWSPTDSTLVTTGGADDKAYMWRVRMYSTVASCVP